jgi:hypothetical protein
VKLNGENIITAGMKAKPVPGTKEFAESFFKEETEQKKNIPDKKTSELPAPFYDELHFANYE